jgi:hypothetical protein
VGVKGWGNGPLNIDKGRGDVRVGEWCLAAPRSRRP